MHPTGLPPQSTLIGSRLIIQLFVFHGFVANYHKFSGLRQHKFVTSQFYRLEVWCGSHWAKFKTGLYSFLETLEENVFPSFFQLYEAALFPWLMAPSFIFKASNGRWGPQVTSLWPCFHITSSLTLNSLPPLPFLRIILITLGSSQQSRYFKVLWLASLMPLCHVT